MLYFKTIKELTDLQIDEFVLVEACKEIFEMTRSIENDFPEYEEWFYNIQMPGAFDKESGRDIIIAYDDLGKIKGTSYINNENGKQSIYVLFVKQPARWMGVGAGLAQKSIEVLKTKYPEIQIPENLQEKYRSIIAKYNWKNTKENPEIFNSVFDKKEVKEQQEK